MEQCLHVAADVEHAVAEARRRRVARADTVRQEVHEDDAVRRRVALLERLQERPRSGARAADEHPVARPDQRDRLGRRHPAFVPRWLLHGRHLMLPTVLSGSAGGQGYTGEP